MKTYLESIAILKSLTEYDTKVQTIRISTGNHSIHGACVFYSFYSVGANFYNVISKEYMQRTYKHYSVNDIHDNYDAYILPDGSLLNIPSAMTYGAWVTIPIKKS